MHVELPTWRVGRALYFGDPDVLGGQKNFVAGPRPGGALAKFSPAWGQSRARRGVVLGLWT